MRHYVVVFGRFRALPPTVSQDSNVRQLHILCPVDGSGPSQTKAPPTTAPTESRDGTTATTIDSQNTTESSDSSSCRLSWDGVNAVLFWLALTVLPNLLYVYSS